MVVANFWAMFSVPPAGILITTVVIVNFGGVYNCIAYTVIRRRLQQQNATCGTQVVLSNGSRPAEAVTSNVDNRNGSITTLTSNFSNQQSCV
jgi:hypothetical protein